MPERGGGQEGGNDELNDNMCCQSSHCKGKPPAARKFLTIRHKSSSVYVTSCCFRDVRRPHSMFIQCVSTYYVDREADDVEMTKIERSDGFTAVYRLVTILQQLCRLKSNVDLLSPISGPLESH